MLLLVAVLIAMTYGRKFSSPAQSGPKKFPVITPDMIEPANKPLSRQDVLSAYRKLCIRHGEYECAGEIDDVDRDTGEVIDDLPAYIEQHYMASGSAKFDDVCDKHDDELTVLFYFAKADGAMRPAEQAILVDYIASFIPEGKPSVAEIEQVVLGWRPPGKGAFWAAVRGIAERSTETLRKVIAVAEQMQATDNDTGKDEQLALNYMRKKLIEAEKSRQ